MPILSAKKLSKSYGAEPLFTDLELTIRRAERVGLIGVNGTGKSTLLRILAGIEAPDSGVVERRRDTTALYLAQQPRLDPERSPRSIVETGLADYQAAVERHRAVSERIAREGPSDALVAEQSELTDRIELLGGWDRGHVVDDVLGKLGVLEPDRPVGTMSGGEQRRVALAHLLVAQPSLAILDEPTNHLDADTIEWLESHLAEEFAGALLLVTHDRYVLDALCDRIVELDRGSLVEYQGGYSAYLEQKAERLAHEERVENNRLNLLRRERAWLERGAKARTSKQRARIQRAEALMARGPARGPGSVQLERLDVAAAGSGKTLLDARKLDVAVGGRVLVSGLDLHVRTGERIGVVGKNGAGKTSLLRAIAGELPPSNGELRLAPQTRIALFDQTRAALRDDWTVFENVAERRGAAGDGSAVVELGDRKLDLRTYLEHFLFDGGKQRQPVGALSGGERARVALAKILKSRSNLLLLDEPANDLDVATLSALEELLVGWAGAIIVVSHDRGLLDRVATSLLVFETAGKVVRYAGNYSDYRLQRPSSPRPETVAKAPPPRAPPAQPAEDAVRPLTYAERLELDGLMDAIASAEAKAAAIETELSDPAFYAQRAAEAAARVDDLTRAKAEVARLIARWEELETRRERRR